MMLEWLPRGQGGVQPREYERAGEDEEALSEVQRLQVDKALALFDLKGSGRFGVEECTAVLEAAGDDIIDAQSVLSEYGNGRWIDHSALKQLILTGAHRKVENGRRMVLLSLAEAETIRAIMHRQQGHSLVEGADTQLALRVATVGGIVIDASLHDERSHQPSLSTPPSMARAAHNAIRFLDSVMHYTTPNLAGLLRALPAPMADRRLFFSSVIGCRRRLSKRWEETPLRHVLSLQDDNAMLVLQAMIARIRAAILSRGLLAHDAFRLFDADTE